MIWKRKENADSIVREHFWQPVVKFASQLPTTHFSPEELPEVFINGLNQAFVNHVRRRRSIDPPPADLIAEEVRNEARIRIVERKGDAERTDDALAWIEAAFDESLFESLVLPDPAITTVALALSHVAKDLDRIVQCYAWVPAHVAKKRAGRDRHKYEDFSQSGFVGLCRAATRYTPDRGAKFSTFAWKVIDNQVVSDLRRYTGKSEHAAVQDQAFDQVQDLLTQALGRMPHDDEVLDKLQWSGRKRDNAKRRLHLSKVVSLSVADDEGNSIEVAGVEPPSSHRLAVAELRAAVKAAMECLHPIEREVLNHKFFGDCPTWEAVGEALGIPESKVRAHKKAAFAKLKPLFIRLGLGESDAKNK